MLTCNHCGGDLPSLHYRAKSGESYCSMSCFGEKEHPDNSEKFVEAKELAGNKALTDNHQPNTAGQKLINKGYPNALD
jgi:hypothetical protein